MQLILARGQADTDGGVRTWSAAALTRRHGVRVDWLDSPDHFLHTAMRDAVAALVVDFLD